MHKRTFLRGAGAMLLTLSAADLLIRPALAQNKVAVKKGPRVEVFKDANCGCCSGWVEHLQASGFEVSSSNVDDTGVYRRRFGIADALGSCHTARVGGYTLEGHVPAADIQRLLREKPQAVGLAVPGMPFGSPGMEDAQRPGARAAFEVLLVRRDAPPQVYQRYAAMKG